MSTPDPSLSTAVQRAIDSLQHATLTVGYLRSTTTAQLDDLASVHQALQRAIDALRGLVPRPKQHD